MGTFTAREIAESVVGSYESRGEQQPKQEHSKLWSLDTVSVPTAAGVLVCWSRYSGW